MPKHRTRRNVRGGVALGAVLAAVSLTTAAVYTGTATAADAPAPDTDCVALVQTLITAQVGEDAKSRQLKQAEHADKLAQAKRDSAVAAAQTAYKAGQPYTGVIDVKHFPGDTQAAADARADAAAKAARDAKIQDANNEYQAGGTATALVKAQKAEAKTSGVLAEIKLRVGQLCVNHPVPPTTTEPTPVPEVPAPAAPAPAIQETHLPVTH